MENWLSESEIAVLKEVISDLKDCDSRIAITHGMTGYDLSPEITDTILLILEEAVGDN